MVKSKVEQPKQYRVKKGYVWLGPDMNPSGAETVMETDPGFEKQRHKLEPITSEQSETEESKSKSKSKVRVTKSSRNRMRGSSSTRRRGGPTDPEPEEE